MDNITCSLMVSTPLVVFSLYAQYAFIIFNSETEADRQIREIMGRVMKHANAVLGDIGKSPFIIDIA